MKFLQKFDEMCICTVVFLLFFLGALVVSDVLVRSSGKLKIEKE